MISMATIAADTARAAKQRAMEAVRAQAREELEMVARAFLAEDYVTAEKRLPYLRQRLVTLQENGS